MDLKDIDFKRQLAIRNAIMAQEPSLPVAETPEQFLARMQGWQLPGQLTAADRGILSAGTALLQPIPVGQSAIGHLGQAIAGGVNAYDAAQRANLGQALTLESSRLKGREAEGIERERAERVAGARGARATAEARAPIDLGQALANYEKAQKELRQIEMEEQAGGPRTPEMIARRAAAETALREAMAKMYGAHAEAYKATADKAQQPRQTLNTTAGETADGRQRITSTIVINGRHFYKTLTLPRYPDIESAREAVRAELKKKAGWFGSVDEQEVEALAKRMSTPVMTIVDDANQPVTEDDLAAAEAIPQGRRAVPPATPRAMPPARRQETQEELAQRNATRIRMLQRELARARTPEEKASIQREIENLERTGTPSGTGSAQRPVGRQAIPKTPAPIDLGAAKAARERAAQATPATPTYSYQKVGPLSPDWLLAEEAAKGNVEAQRILDARRSGLGTFTAGDEPLPGQ
jgi:hypothetical protein